MTAHKQKTGPRVRAVVAPSPFSIERIEKEFTAGLSIAAMLALVQPDEFLRGHAHVFIDGHSVAPENWACVYPKAGSLVNIRLVPTGGGGGRKNPLRTVLSLAVLAASPVLAGSLSGALGAGGSFLGISASRLITTGVNLLGRLAINALAPPPRARLSAARKESAGYFIQGAQNRLQPFARVPKVLGKHRFVPPLGALPYTETVGSEQYLRLLFVWGYGPLSIGDLKIGETPLSEFQDVEVETRQGYMDDAPLTLYSNAVLQNDLQVALRQSGGYQLRVSEAEAEELSVDVTFPRGLFQFDGAHNKRSACVEIEVQYSPAGANDWSAPATGFKSVAAQTSIVLPLPEAYVTGGVTHIVTRIDRVGIDVASGVISVVSGTPHRGGVDAGVAEIPALPPHLRPLARITRRSNQILAIEAGDIVDERATAFDGSQFQNSGDFASAAGATAGTLAVAAGGVQYRPLVISARQTTTLRRVASFKVPKGQYDVRLKRLSADATDDKVFDEVTWTALRSVRSSRPVRMTGLALTALRIRATDQLNGMIDRFNGVVQSIVPDWDGASWVMQPSCNPASLFRHVLQGAGNARPLADSRLDLARLIEWHDRCREAGREFNVVIDGDQSVREVLADVAAVGRASPAVIDGRWSVIEDRAQSVPVQHFTPRNTFGFQGQKSFDEEPEALRVRFLNRDKGWLQDERLVYADGVTAETAQRYETLELSGVTDAAQVWKDGRYHMATARLRPETYRFSTDIEHIVCTRGDLIRLTHDVPLFGLQAARVAQRVETGGQLTGVVLDAQVTQQAGKSYCLRLRLEDGESLLASVITVAGSTPEVAFATPLALATNIKRGDLAMFGEAGQESVALVVRAIEPQSDLSARLTCVDAAPAIHVADQGAIPAFHSHVTLPPEMQTPPTPQVAEIQSGEESLIRNTDGSLTTRIVLSLAPVSFSQPVTLQVLLRGQGEEKYRVADVFSASATQVSIVGVEEGQRYDLQLRYLSAGGARSAPKLISNYQVQGTLAEPSDVEALNIAVLGDVLTLSWPRVADIDLSHYTLRYTPQEGSVNWSNAIDLVSRIAMDATSLSLPAAKGSYLIKAVDIGGRQSRVAAVAVSPVGAVEGYNAVLAIEESASFSGEKDGLALVDGALRLDGADSIDGWDNFDDTPDVDLGDSGLLSEGTYYFSQTHDLGDCYTSRVSARLHVEGIDMNQTVDDWLLTDDIENWDDNIDPSLWSVVLELRLTTQDPLIEAGWGGWQPFVIGDYTARAFEFRLCLRSNSPNITPVVTWLEVDIDMPDRIESGSDLLSDVGGSTVSFVYPFRAAPALAIAPRDMASGEYYTLSLTVEDSFFIRFFNAGGSGVARRFDYVAKGFGQII